MPFLRIYPASKTRHSIKWIEAHATWEHVHFTARWIKQVTIDGGDILKTQASHEWAARCWIEDIEDIQHSDYLMLYAEPEEHLRGALVEAGAAIASGIPVILIGEHPDYGTWQWHPDCIHVANLSAFQTWCELELKKRIAQSNARN